MLTGRLMWVNYQELSNCYQFWLTDWQTDTVSDWLTADHVRHFAATAFLCCGSCRGVYGLRLRSSIFCCRTCVYGKTFRHIPLVGPNAISKNSNNVVISSPRDFIFSWILVPRDIFSYIWSRDLEHFRFGRQGGAPKIFFQTRFSRQPLVRFPHFFQGRVPPEGLYLSFGGMGVGRRIWGPDLPKWIFKYFFLWYLSRGWGAESVVWKS